ncbi:MAG: excinuclease ABC subunit UvrA, partial [bacterium]
MSKPDVDSIEGLSPAISIEQRSAAGTPRSIVATTTDIHDYLRLLWAHAGIPHCPRCSRPVSAQSAAQIVRALLELPAGAKLTLLSPLVRGRKGAHLDRFDAARRQGFVRARVDGTIADLDDLPALDKRKAHTIEIVVDRLVSGENMRARLADSVELALRHGEGVLVALWQSSGAAPEERVFAERLACAECGISFAPLTARHFSFNSPHGACPHCSGLGVRLVPDPELVVPDRTKPLQEAIPAWRRGGRRMILYYRWVLKALAQHYGVELSTPFSELPESFLEVLWHGSGTEPVAFGRGRGANALRREKPFEGLLPNLERRYLETESESFQALLRTYMRRQACDVCHGARLKPEALAVTVDGLSLAAFLKLSVRDALSQIDGMPLSENDRRVVGNVIREVHERLSFLQEVGLDYLTLDRESATLSGGESQR